ncbi:hypothetical protein K439DRAFT_1117516 [Ramaria rubella]|nr:hypothetical protein K439DRAFT_1117516 [Ramaria rubella]
MNIVSCPPEQLLWYDCIQRPHSFESPRCSPFHGNRTSSLASCDCAHGAFPSRFATICVGWGVFSVFIFFYEELTLQLLEP